MLYRYINKYADAINRKMPVGHEKDYTQRDIFELIAEILNLRQADAYSYEDIRTSYGNYLKTKSPDYAAKNPKKFLA